MARQVEVEQAEICRWMQDADYMGRLMNEIPATSKKQETGPK